MQTRLIAVIVLFTGAIISCAGCAGGGSGGGKSGAKTIEVGPSETGRAVSARVGETVTVLLPGRQGSDAVWRDQVPDALQLVSMGEQKTGTIGPSKTSWTVAELKPTRPGKYVAVFSLVRVWQQTMENERTFRLTVDVTE